ncbi:MAG: magnesium/cobalt transporter CorA [Rhodothermales bacterium]|nr:magnesium/cobalt transporter CorA [Rhodothermales bacterium]
MHRLVRPRKKPGTAPGTIVFIGDVSEEPVAISSFNYDVDKISESRHGTIDEALAIRKTGRKTWINIDGLNDGQVLAKVGADLDLHPLVLEDIASLNQRPKVEIYQDYIYVVLRMITSSTSGASLSSEQVSLVIGPDYLISFQERPGDVFDPVRGRLRQGNNRIRKFGTDYLAYALIDVIVDYYFLTLESIDERMEEVEDDITIDPSPNEQDELRRLRTNLIVVRRATWPVREMISQLERLESHLISDDVKPYLHDVYDHAVQVIDIVESMRDVLGGLNDLYMTGISNRMNDIMKVLTIIGTIFIPLTFIAGIYGMNFENIPELHTQNGYFVSLAVMAAIALGLLYLFRRKHWI